MKEVFNITIVSAVACTTHLMGNATHTIGEKISLTTPSSVGSSAIGMLLDLDEGTLSVYKNGRKLGVMKRGLAGHYCWVVAFLPGRQVTIKRGPVPAS